MGSISSINNINIGLKNLSFKSFTEKDINKLTEIIVEKAISKPPFDPKAFKHFKDSENFTAKIKDTFSKIKPNNLKITTSTVNHQSSLIQVPIDMKEQSIGKRVLHALGFKTKPAYNYLPRPTDKVMEAFHSIGLPDIETAKLVEELRKSGIQTEEDLIAIVKEMPSPIALSDLKELEKLSATEGPKLIANA